MKILLIGKFPDFVVSGIGKKLKIVHLKKFEPGKNLRDIETSDIMVITAGVKVDRKFLERAKSLKTLITFTHGYEHVDREALKSRGIKFKSVPGSTPSVAELTFGLMISVIRKIPEQDGLMKKGEWKRDFGRELCGKTLGVIGLGPIGREVCRIARSFGMRVVATDPNKLMKGGMKVEMVSLDRLLKTSDIVSLHAHLNEETKHMIGRKELGRMKRSAILINTGRGGLIDSEALHESLRSGRIAGAGLDVFEREPPGRDKLVRLQNVVATPHAGADTIEGEERKIKILLDILKKKS
ncbi:MAG: 3-phosphoglycerate dehydrogenase [Candidatus Aenigmarchaeota archaeon]|nr:3-phosphoglycerate dehydrogenase [Candidatus Aenigmarchaeota archaeon]